MRALLQELLESVKAGRELAYCAVVATRGSTPQKAGAAMLVYPDGRQSGTLGGGCVEAEVKQRALRCLVEADSGAAASQPALGTPPRAGRPCHNPAILTFTLDDNYGWDDGLICGGRMEMLVEAVRGLEGLEYFERLADLVEKGDGATQAVVLDPQSSGLQPAGAHYLFDAQGTLVGLRHGPEPNNGELDELSPVQARRRPWTHRGVAYVPIHPRCRLVIVGGGHVGQAVAQLAAQADFDIWVVDDRQAYANRERFPQAERHVVGEIGPTLAELEITPFTFCLIVTRGHGHDEEALYQLADRGARYVGLIGSKRKIRLICDDLIAQGLSPEVLQRVHAPVGFDIGSQTVPEIAVSIVAELIAHRNLGESPEYLRGRASAADPRAGKPCSGGLP